MTGDNPWVVTWQRLPDAPAVLLCVPPAGAGCGQFRAWQQLLAPAVQVLGVQLPGREERWPEPAAESVAEIVDAVAPGVADVAGGRPLVIFGHSFGGLLGYEIAGRLGTGHGAWPVALVVAACGAPSHWARMAGTEFGDPARLGELLDSRGLDDLDEDTRAELMELLLADARLGIEYPDPGDRPVACDVQSWTGALDDTVPEDAADAWAVYTTGEFTRRVFPGGHFFCADDPTPTVGALHDLIGRYRPAAIQEAT